MPAPVTPSEIGQASSIPALNPVPPCAGAVPTLEVEFWHCLTTAKREEAKAALRKLGASDSLWSMTDAHDLLLDEDKQKEEHYLNVDYDPQTPDLHIDRTMKRVRGVVRLTGSDSERKKIKIQFVDESGTRHPEDKGLNDTTVTLKPGESKHFSLAVNRKEELFYRLQAEEIVKKDEQGLKTVSKGSIQTFDLDFEVEFLHEKTIAREAGDVGAEAYIMAMDPGTLIKDDKDARDKYILTKTARHYVNLKTQEDKWKLDHVDRTTRNPRIVVRFKNHHERDIDVDIIPGRKNIKYSEREIGEDPFKDPVTYSGKTTNGCIILNKNAIEDISINVAGGNKYNLLATDKKSGKKVRSKGTIETWRYLWLQTFEYSELKNGIDYADIASLYKRHFIILNTSRHKNQKLIDPSIEIELSSRLGDFKTAIKNLYHNGGGTGKETEPYTITLASVSMCDVVLSPIRSPTLTHPTYTEPLKAGQTTLRKEICPPIYSSTGTFPHSDWLDGAVFDYIDPSSGQPVIVNLPNASCRVVPQKDSRLSAIIEVDRALFPTSIPAGIAGRVHLWVRSQVSSTINGWSQYNFCALAMERPHVSARNGRAMRPRRATRPRPIPPPPADPPPLEDAGPQSTATHELGHFMNMVPNGGPLPDDLGNYIDTRAPNDPGPQPHCKGKVSLRPCVMLSWGKYDRSERFCEDCQKQLRRMDLSAGRTAYF